MTELQLRLEALKIATFAIDKFVVGRPDFDDIDRLADHLMNYVTQGQSLVPSEDKLDLPLAALQMPSRAYNALTAWGIGTVRHLICNTYADLVRLPGMGPKAAAQVEQALKLWHLDLKPIDKSA